MTEEEWRPMLGAEPRYMISTLGCVRDVPHWSRGGKSPRWVPAGPVKPPINGQGYPCLVVYRDDRKFKVLLHRAMLETFVGPCPDGMVCRHLNGDKLDARLTNLAWGTPAENADDNRRLVATVRIASVRQLLWIQEQFDSGVSASEIARILGINRQRAWAYACSPTHRRSVAEAYPERGLVPPRRVHGLGPKPRPWKRPWSAGAP